MFQQKIVIISKFLSPPQQEKNILKGMDMHFGKSITYVLSEFDCKKIQQQVLKIATQSQDMYPY